EGRGLTVVATGGIAGEGRVEREPWSPSRLATAAGALLSAIGLVLAAGAAAGGERLGLHADAGQAAAGDPGQRDVHHAGAQLPGGGAAAQERGVLRLHLQLRQPLGRGADARAG